MSRSVGVAAVLIVAASPLIAQPAPPQPMPMMSEMMETCMQMMTGTAPAFLLGHRQALSLTSDQVSKLEAIRTRTEQTAGRHMDTAMKEHMAANAMLSNESPDFTVFETRLKDAASDMVQTHVALARGAVEARQVLTAEQRSRLATLPSGMGRMGAPPQPGTMGGPPRQGMQNGPMDHGMMMMCMGRPAPQGGMPHR